MEFETFCNENAHWLDDYTLYVTLKDSFHGAAWYDWPEDLRHRKEAAMSEWRNTLNDKILMEKFFSISFFQAVVFSEKIL